MRDAGWRKNGGGKRDGLKDEKNKYFRRSHIGLAGCGMRIFFAGRMRDGGKMVAGSVISLSPTLTSLSSSCSNIPRF